MWMPQSLAMPGAAFGVYLHPDQAADLGLNADDPVCVTQHEATATARVILDDRVPLGCARIPSGVAGSEGLGDQIGPITLERLTEPATGERP